MKNLILAIFLVSTAIPQARGESPEKAAEAESTGPKPATVDPALHPTGLTIVLMDADNKVLDTVKVPDDKKHYQITFSSGDHQKIKVFALGTRISKDIPAGMSTTGISKQDGGLGRVEVLIESGELAGMRGNGYGTFALTEAISTAIAADLKEGKPVDLTEMDELVEDDSEEAE